MLDGGAGCYYVAAATGERYMDLATYVSRGHSDPDAPERVLFWQERETCPYTWRPDNTEPLEHPMSRIVK